MQTKIKCITSTTQYVSSDITQNPVILTQRIHHCFKEMVEVTELSPKSNTQKKRQAQFKQDDTLIVIHKQKNQLIPLLPSPLFPSSFLASVLLFHQLSYLAGQPTPFQDNSSVVPSHFSVAHSGLEPKKTTICLSERKLNF